MLNHSVWHYGITWRDGTGSLISVVEKQMKWLIIRLVLILLVLALINLPFISLSMFPSLLLSSLLVFVSSTLSVLHFSLSFSQYGGMGPVSHSGGPGVWCATCHHQRGIWPPHRRGHPKAGGKDTWVTVCLSISVFRSVFLSVTVHRLKIVTYFAWTHKNSHSVYQ